MKKKKLQEATNRPTPSETIWNFLRIKRKTAEYGQTKGRKTDKTKSETK